MSCAECTRSGSRRRISGLAASSCRPWRGCTTKSATIRGERWRPTSSLVEEDETNLDALEKLEQLATMLSDWDVLVRGLRIKAELVDDSEERASLWRRVGETRRDMLDQPELRDRGVRARRRDRAAQHVHPG